LAFQPSPTKASHRSCDAREQSQGSPPPQLRHHSCATKHSQRPLTNSALHQTNPNAQTKHIKLNRVAVVPQALAATPRWIGDRAEAAFHCQKMTSVESRAACQLAEVPELLVSCAAPVSLSVRIPLFSRAIVMPPLTRRLYRSQSANVSTIQNEKYTVVVAAGERP